MLFPRPNKFRFTVNNDESESPPIFLILVDDHANVRICLYVDYASESCWSSYPFGFFINRTIEHIIVKSETDRDYMGLKRKIAGS